MLSSGELAGTIDEVTRISLYLYRVTVNEHSRQQRPGLMSIEQQAPLGLDLHFLLTAWAGNAQDELLTIAGGHFLIAVFTNINANYIKASGAKELYFYAGLMFVVSLVFMVIAKFCAKRPVSTV